MATRYDSTDMPKIQMIFAKATIFVVYEWVFTGINSANLFSGGEHISAHSSFTRTHSMSDRFTIHDCHSHVTSLTIFGWFILYWWQLWHIRPNLITIFKGSLATRDAFKVVFNSNSVTNVIENCSFCNEVTTVSFPTRALGCASQVKFLVLPCATSSRRAKYSRKSRCDCRQPIRREIASNCFPADGQLSELPNVHVLRLADMGSNRLGKLSSVQQQAHRPPMLDWQ
ncbi:unnamed protein product [Somion occarium]|uniref:Uncharacterized protein n=1 Tax=Somion occarium TaxID=3059160 RepID=A0ABP1DSN5_9APHY